MAEIMWVSLGLTCILQLIIILMVGAKVRHIERTINAHGRLFDSLNRLDKATAHQIVVMRAEIKGHTHSPDHSHCHCFQPLREGRGERTIGDDQHR
jgi:hypothetical protein